METKSSSPASAASRPADATATPTRSSGAAPLGDVSAARPNLVDFVRAVQESPNDVKAHVDLATRLLGVGRAPEAEVVLRAAIELNPFLPGSHANLALALERQLKVGEAIENYRRAIEIDPNCRARKFLSDCLVRAGRPDEALALWEDEIVGAPHDAAPWREAMTIAMSTGRTEAAARYARGHAALRFGSRFWPDRRADDPPYSRMVQSPMKAPKLRHDIEQLEYLREKKIVGDEIRPMVEGLERALARVAKFGEVQQVLPNVAERREIGALYNHIVHVTPAPRLPRALSAACDIAAREDEYIRKPPGIIVVDGLLSDEALESLRRYCVESTIWSTSRYANGYLGSMVGDGFDAPLLFQIAEELREAMPRVIGDRPLTQLWAFKYDQEMTGINLHADSAAVNVNFWITPDDANLDPETGGLIVYDVEAPQEWASSQYNEGRSNEEIQAWLDEVGARAVTFPYRQNRAVIFNSDLFHQTAPLKFKPGYANRRVNVTMLYGHRSDQRLDVGAPPRT